MKSFCEKDQAPKKDKVRGGSFRWKLVGSSLVRASAESFGFNAARRSTPLILRLKTLSRVPVRSSVRSDRSVF